MDVGDAEFMLDLRHRDGIREHVNQTSHAIEDQRAWIRRCLDSESDHSFVLVDRDRGERTGSFSIYDGDGSRARIGRWLVRPGSRSVPEFALLGYGACFDVLRLGSVFCRIPDDNAAALAFQKRIRTTPRGATAQVELNGRAVTLLEFELRAERWPDVRDILRPLAEACHDWSGRRDAASASRVASALSVVFHPGQTTSAAPRDGATPSILSAAP